MIIKSSTGSVCWTHSSPGSKAHPLRSPKLNVRTPPSCPSLPRSLSLCTFKLEPKLTFSLLDRDAHFIQHFDRHEYDNSGDAQRDFETAPNDLRNLDSPTTFVCNPSIFSGTLRMVSACGATQRRAICTGDSQTPKTASVLRVPKSLPPKFSQGHNISSWFCARSF